MSRGITLTTMWTMQLVVACGLFGAAQAAAHGQGFGLVIEPEKDDPQSAIAYRGAGQLRAAFPSLSELEQGGVRMKPESYKGLSVESQPLRVLRNDETDVGLIILGHDELGPTKLHSTFEQGKDGKVELNSLAGVPGTEWILSPKKLVTAGDIQVRGLRLRVLVRQYGWRDPAADKRELIDKVVHIETENIDNAMPGELLYFREGKEVARFMLSEKRGLFIVTNYASDAAHLIEARGWRKVDRGGHAAPLAQPATDLETFVGKWIDSENKGHYLVVSLEGIRWERGDIEGTEFIPVSKCKLIADKHVVSFPVRSSAGAIIDGKIVRGSQVVEMSVSGDCLTILEGTSGEIRDVKSGFGFRQTGGTRHVFKKEEQKAR